MKILKIHTPKRFLGYYSIYSVAGVIFNKDYFLTLWKDHKNTVNEGLQLFNALTYFNKNDLGNALKWLSKSEFELAGTVISSAPGLLMIFPAW